MGDKAARESSAAFLKKVTPPFADADLTGFFGKMAELTGTSRRYYEAAGEPYLMLALVGNEGVSRVTIGVAFNHYEFTGPLARRYSDADWQERVYRTPPQLPRKNFWYQGLAVK